VASPRRPPRGRSPLRPRAGRHRRGAPLRPLRGRTLAARGGLGGPAWLRADPCPCDVGGALGTRRGHAGRGTPRVCVRPRADGRLGPRAPPQGDGPAAPAGPSC
jgi:hypothetical protein